MVHAYDYNIVTEFLRKYDITVIYRVLRTTRPNLLILDAKDNKTTTPQATLECRLDLECMIFIIIFIILIV